MTAVKNFCLIIPAIILCGCSISGKDVERFAIGITKNFIDRDSVGLYKKQMDGKTSGTWGFYTYASPNDKFQTPKEFVELSEKRYSESRNSEMEALGRLIENFNCRYPSIASMAIDTLYVANEGEVGNLRRGAYRKKQVAQYKEYSIAMIIVTENGDTAYFRPGHILELDGKLYFGRESMAFSETRFPVYH